MGWSLGWDSNWNRDIGYGVPAICDHPKCNARIDRGLAYVCCGQQPYGGYGERGGGCGLFFCGDHHGWGGKCPKCQHGHGSKPYKAKPDCREWLEWKLKHPSWAKWRKESPDEVAECKAALATAPVRGGLEDDMKELSCDCPCADDCSEAGECLKAMRVVA